jgi:hypothetical protein
MPQPHPDFTSTQNAEGGWIFLVSGDRISGLHTADGFRRGLRAGTLDLWPKLTRRRALYILAEPDGIIRAACAFALRFDSTGAVRRELDLPLRELALRGGDGPDLGKGRIRLCSAAQCPRPELLDDLWGDSTWELIPPLVDAQLRLTERFGLRRPRRPPEPPEGCAAARAQARLRASLGEAGTIGEAALARGRALAAEAGNRTHRGFYSEEEVQRLREQDRRSIAALKRDLVMLRRRLTAAATS